MTNLLPCPNCWHDSPQIIAGNAPADGVVIVCKAPTQRPADLSKPPIHVCRFHGAWCPTKAQAIAEWNSIDDGVRTIEHLQTLQADFETRQPTINQLLRSKGLLTSVAPGNYRKHIHGHGHVVFTGTAGQVCDWLETYDDSMLSQITKLMEVTS